MKIKYLVAMAGSDYSRSVGDVADVDTDEGARLVAAGYAVPVADEGKAERATAKRTAAETR